MRRRLNIAECGRLKRLPTKKARITEPVPTSSYLHGKLLLGWLVILLLDSIADFRFEYLYPAVMFMRSVYDSYKYQGLIFSLLFICMVMYLDLLCWTVLSAQWLFLGASSCVWMEVMRNTDYNFSYYTLSLWMLFLYFEVSYRLHNLPQHLLNVSRPFAAHCIGYPVVTMSFLLKHQITHIIRHRQQKKIAEENSFYFDVLQKALPPAPEETKTAEDSPKEKEERKDKEKLATTVEEVANDHKAKVSPKTASSRSSRTQNSSGSRHNRGNSGSKYSEQKALSKPPEQEAGHVSTTSPVTNGDIVRPSSAGSGKLHIPSGKKQATVKAVPRSEPLQSTPSAQQPDKLKITIESLQTEVRLERAARAQAEAASSSLELEIKKLKADLQASCLQEEETTHRVDQLMSLEKTHRNELQRLRNESDTLQSKVTKLSTGKQHDQDFISSLEKRLKEESETRQRLESELRHHLGAVQNAWSEEEVREIQKQLTSCEKESAALRKKLLQKDKVCEELQRELASCHARVRSLEEVVLQLKASLGDETRVKIELFTALSDARRQKQSLSDESQRKSLEINKLKQNLAEIMAILPAPTSSTPTSVTFTHHPH